MILRTAFLVGLIWIFVSTLRRNPSGAIGSPPAKLIAPPELTSDQRAQALANAVANWKAARDEEGEQGQGSCRRTHE